MFDETNNMTSSEDWHCPWQRRPSPWASPPSTTARASNNHVAILTGPSSSLLWLLSFLLSSCRLFQNWTRLQSLCYFDLSVCLWLRWGTDDVMLMLWLWLGGAGWDDWEPSLCSRLFWLKIEIACVIRNDILLLPDWIIINLILLTGSLCVHWVEITEGQSKGGSSKDYDEFIQL